MQLDVIDCFDVHSANKQNEFLRGNNFNVVLHRKDFLYLKIQRKPLLELKILNYECGILIYIIFNRTKM